ncbi:MAG: polysaccharide biosynthesis protein [Clostridiales bacterium]|nr:polysaccharide biosynthesis protein [Clostridiales bacterium]
MSDGRVPLNKRTFMYGAAILSAAGILIKILGAVFRIPLGNLIGDEGMGYYNAVYPIYTLLVVIATTGIPIAVSRLVAEHYVDDDPGGANRVFKTALGLMCVIGVGFFCVLFFGASAITSSLTDLSDAVHAMRAIAPALIFVPVMAAFRGYFQGMQNMKPTALSQVTEQIFRIVIGLALAFALMALGTDYAAAGGTFGATAGAVAGLVTLIIIYSRMRKTASYREKREVSRQERDRGRRDSTGSIIKKIAVIAIPITVGAAIMPIMYNIDVWVVPARLSFAGFDAATVRSMYGQLTGFAEPITNLPKVLTQAIAISMVPTIVRAWKEKDRDFLKYNITLGLRFAFIIGLPCTVGLMILAEPVMFLLYPFQPEAAAGAAPALFIFAIGIVFLSSIDALTSTLQGVGKQMIPFINIAIGAGCKLVITYFLTGIPSVNIKGAAIGTIVAFAVATVLNYRAVVTYTGTRFDLNLTFVRPIISGLVMGGVVAAVYFGLYGAISGSGGSLAQLVSEQLQRELTGAMLSNAIATMTAILAGIIVYIVMLFVSRSIKGEELRLLPKGEKLYRFYRKVTRKRGAAK